MKKLITAILIVTSFACPLAFSKGNKQALDQTIAIVNDDVISRSELNKALSTASLMMSQEHVATPSSKALQKQVLEQLINKKIQLQIAKQSGVAITDVEMEKAITRIAEQNHLSKSDLYSRISQDGMSVDEYRNEIRDQMTMQKLQQQEVASKMTISHKKLLTSCTHVLGREIFQKNIT